MHPGYWPLGLFTLLLERPPITRTHLNCRPQDLIIDDVVEKKKNYILFLAPQVL